MVNRSLQPQEVEVFYILPALRRDLALALKESGKSQKQIAGLLQVTESAISQYMSSKRAASVPFDDAIKKKIAQAAGRIVDKASLTCEMQKLLRLIRDEKIICKVHARIGDVPEECRVCFE